MEIYKARDLQDVKIQEIIKIEPESRFVIIVSNDTPHEAIWNLKDQFDKFLNSNDQFFLIVGDVKFVKVIKDQP